MGMLAQAREVMAPDASETPAPAVVAMGASAGGLEALQSLLARLRPNGRTSYVVAQHMANDSHHGLVCELLQRTCGLPVRLMTPDETPVADTVTLIPSGCHAQWQAGHWVMTPPSDRYFSTPSVDALLVSLAQGLGPQAAGVILSGLLPHQAMSVIAAYRARGLVLVKQQVIDGWSSLLMQAP